MMSMNSHTVAAKAVDQRRLDDARKAFEAKGGQIRQVSPGEYDHTRAACPLMRSRGRPKADEDFGVPKPELDQ